MKVMVATKEMQGVVQGDYCWCVEGELVTGVVVACCDGDRCGCSRGWTGLASSRATTTALVVDRPGVTEADLREAVRDHLERAGWIDLVTEANEPAGWPDDEGGPDDLSRVAEEPEEVISELVDEHVEAIVAICRSVPDGTVLSRQGGRVMARTMPRAA
jgi:hypothetical protein